MLVINSHLAQEDSKASDADVVSALVHEYVIPEVEKQSNENSKLAGAAHKSAVEAGNDTGN